MDPGRGKRKNSSDKENRKRDGRRGNDRREQQGDRGRRSGHQAERGGGERGRKRWSREQWEPKWDGRENETEEKTKRWKRGQEQNRHHQKARQGWWKGKRPMKR